MRYSSNEVDTVKSGRLFFNKRQLAEHLNISIYTIDSWVSQKREIPFVKMGRAIRFYIKDVEKWIEDHKTNPLNS